MLVFLSESQHYPRRPLVLKKAVAPGPPVDHFI